MLSFLSVARKQGCLVNVTTEEAMHESTKRLNFTNPNFLTSPMPVYFGESASCPKGDNDGAENRNK